MGGLDTAHYLYRSFTEDFFGEISPPAREVRVIARDIVASCLESVARQNKLILFASDPEISAEVPEE